MKTTSLSIIALVILVTLFMGVNGYRLSGEAAARANPYVEKTARLIDQVDYSWGAVYMFQNDEHPVTAVSRKKLGFVWKSNTSVYYHSQYDPINTVGGITINEPKVSATVITFEVNDPEVDYLVVGRSDNKQIKIIGNQKYISFHWDEAILWNELEYVAYNVKDEPLYANDPADNEVGFKWYEVE